MARWAVVAACALTSVAAAQGGGVVPRRGPVDTTKRTVRDSTKRDSLTIAPPDSAERALMSRKGYLITRYQGDSVTFSSGSNSLRLYGAPALVERDKTRASGDSIIYDQVKQMILVGGKPSRVKDPSNPEDIVAREPITYYLDERRGTAGQVSTKASSGSVWCIDMKRGGFSSDTARSTMYAKDAKMTTDCSPDPQYYFQVGELKQVSENYMVARPAVLHIGEVPVFWIPWLPQDLRKGRRTGILTPRFGFAELVRNSATYRRTVENVGMYFAASEYFDSELSFDWRSGARPTERDPGWIRLHANGRYAWRDRFLTGTIGVSRFIQDDGVTSMGYTWMHSQKFSQKSQLQANIQYTTSTSIEQRTQINPAAVIGTIASQLSYQTQFGPFQTTIGGSQHQYPGRDQIDRELPNMTISTKPLALTNWLTWTPSLNTSTSQSLHLDSPSEFSFRYVPRPDGLVDTVRLDRSTRNTSLNFTTPLKVGALSVTANMRMADRENDFPEAKLVIDPSDTSKKQTIVYKRTYLTTFDWDLGVNLPSFSQGRWNATPSVRLQNVDPGAYLVRTERTGADYVAQSKRLAYGIGFTPTFFALLDHRVGPFMKIRHSVTPTVSYTYSPEATVSDAYLGALGRTRAGYLGSIAQNRVSLTLNQVFEAKLRAPADSSPESGRKIRLLSLNFSAVDYDFERARVTKRSGFATDRFNFNARSDLLPGLDFGVDYSLFDAPSISDTANFKPYPENVHANLSIGSTSGLVKKLGHWIGWLTGEEAQEAPKDSTRAGQPGQPGGVTTGSQPGANPLPTAAFANMVGGRSRPSLMSVPTGQGWQATLNFTASHPRPPRGSNVVAIDPRASCEIFRDTSPLQYNICIGQNTPLYTDQSQSTTTGGGVVYRYPAQSSLNGSLTFNLTKDWAAQWQTNYDLALHQFASQTVSLQRDIHDWRAIFGFTQAPNGNFAFNFLISLKPAPDIQVPYYRPSYKSPGAVSPP